MSSQEQRGAWGHLKGMLTSATLGFVMSAFYGIAEWSKTGALGFSRTVFIGALIGAAIYTIVNLLEYPVAHELARRRNNE